MPTSTDNAVEQATRRRGPVQCEPLLDAATRNLFSNNAFRITGLSVEATPREVAKHADKLKLMEELRQSAAIHTGAVALKPPPTLDQIREATQRLRDPEKRLIDEFFWFWPWEPGRTTPDPALEALASGNPDAALKIWAANETNPSNGVVATHNIALFWQLRALDLEPDNAGPEADPAQEQALENYWRNSLKRWKYLTSDDLLWDKVASRVRQLGDQRLTGGFVRQMRATLPLSLAKVNAELALAHAKKGRMSLARMHVQLLGEGSEESAALFGKAAELVLAPTEARLSEQIKRAQDRAKNSPQDAVSAARELLQQAQSALPLYDLFFGKAGDVRNELFEEVASACNHLQLVYYNATRDDKTCLEILELLLPLATSAELRQAIAKDISDTCARLALSELSEKLAPIHTLCEAATEAAQAKPASADKQAHRILSAAPNLLSSLSSGGLPRGVIDRATDEVALAVMHCAVAFGNKTDKWKECIPILERSLRLAVSADAKNRVIKNLQTAQANAPYADLAPISSAPSLSTINGIGLALYGSTDNDPATGSYLATYYFVVLWIPIFPICRYRVTRSGDSYRFLGQAPLRPFDKWHLAFSIGLIICLIVAGLNSPSSAPEYTPPPPAGPVTSPAAAASALTPAAAKPPETFDVVADAAAAEQGDASSQYKLGLCYAKGLGVAQDYVEAVKWFRKAAEQGSTAAQHSLGISYEKGQGVPQDFGEAVKWYSKALQQGAEFAMTNPARAKAEQTSPRPSNDPTRRTSRPLTPPATPSHAVPPPAPAPATFAPAASPTPPATSTSRSYTVPSSVRAELDTAKQQIAIEKAKATALDTRLATAKQGVAAQKSQVADLQSRLQTFARQIDTDRIYLDRTSQSDIDDFNAKVSRYNTLRGSVRAENATANELIDSYNTLLEEAEAQDRVVNQLVDNYNAKLQ